MVLITTASSSISDVEMSKEEDGMQTCYTFAIPLGENENAHLLSVTRSSPEYAAPPQTVERV